MNEKIQFLIETIAEHASEEIGVECHKIFAYATVQDSVSSVCLFWQERPETTVFYQEPVPDEKNNNDLFYYFYALQQEWSKANNGHGWIANKFLIQDCSISMGLVYADEFDKDLPYEKASRESAKKYFGTSNIDYHHRKECT